MSNPKYRFFIYLNDDDGVMVPVTPFYKDDISKEYELENDQKFYRTKLSGKISFLRDDFDYIMAQSFETQYNLLIQRSDDWGITWVYEFLGKFFKTDCKVTEDDKKIEVQPDPVDEYTEVLAGLDKEYNLIPLAPEIDSLVFNKRPLIQVYIPGDNIVSCFLGGNYWEQDANATTDLDALVDNYHFALCNLLKEINITVNGTPTEASGLYTGKMSISVDNGFETMKGTLYRSGDTTYFLYIEQVKFQSSSTFGSIKCELKRTSDNAVMHRFEQVASGGDSYDNMDFTMTAVSGTGTAKAEMATYRIYARYLLDVDKISTLDTYELPGDDIVDYNRNYRRAIGYAIDVAYISQNFSTTPTEWGRADNLRYYLPPYSIFGDAFYPIARSTWRYASIWFSFSYLDNFIEVQGRKRYMLRDTYPVHSVINTLLKEFAPDITHTETPDCSLFFYGAQNPITYQKFKLFVTQKTNILNGAYTQPAQKAPATLGQFLNMLRDTYRCYWHIENGKLRIEHVSWYENGGSYSGGDVIGIDLTTLMNVRNGKSWAFSSSAYEFDKVDMPERYQFNWMDDVTLAFDGMPIEVKSKYVTPGKIEEISIANFTSDIDMMLLNPSEMSKDGFAIFATVGVNSLVAPDNPADTPPFNPTAPPVDPPTDPQPPQTITLKNYSYPVGFAKKEMSVGGSDYLGMWPKYASLIGSENKFKWGNVLNDDGTYNWVEADNLYNYAVANNLPIHLHCPMWYNDFPPIMQALIGTSNGYETGKAIVYDFYNQLFDRYQGRVRSADIVNEQITDGGTEIQTGWRELFGDDLWEIGFGAAQAADPNVMALITDFNYETGNMNRTNTTIAIINRLKSKGIKVDGIGFQFHTNLGQDIDVMRSRFRIWDGMDLKVMITELDIKTNVGGRGTVYTPAMARELADMYVNITDAYEKALRAINRLGILMWSVTDRQGENFMNLNGIIHHPMLFDEFFQPKLAYTEMINRLSRPAEIHEIYQDFELGNISSVDFIGSQTQGASPATWQMISSDPNAKAEVTDQGLSMAQTQVNVFNHVVVQGSKSDFTFSTRTGTVFDFDVRVLNVAFRFVDGNNMFCVQAYRSGTIDVWRLVKRKGGVDSVLHTSDVKPVWGQVVSISCLGSAISYSINGTVIISITDTDFQTAKMVGFKFKGHYDWDKFSSVKFIKYDPKF
jgi:GH35 family endo-1,4-beta-xylanase